MAHIILTALLDEGKWLFASMLLSLIAAVWTIRRHRRVLSTRGQILLAMNLFWGCTIAMMAFGHLLGVSIKLVQGTLRGSWLLLYPLGIVLAVPAWWLVARAARYVREEARFGNRLAMLNGWLGITLLALGLPNLPLAVPAVWNLAYQFHTRRAVGWTIVTVAVAANVALFIGALVFLASGQTFEQFQGIE
jgi:hypothetical protein